MTAYHPSVFNSTLTQNFRIFNRSTLASFDNAVHIRVTMTHIFSNLFFFKSQSGNRAFTDLIRVTSHY